jgi:hypothetical protein
VATFEGRGVLRNQRLGSPTAVIRFSRPKPLLFLSSSSSVVLTRLSGPRSRPTTSQKTGSAGNRTQASGSIARNSDYYTTEGGASGFYTIKYPKYYTGRNDHPLSHDSLAGKHKWLFMRALHNNFDTKPGLYFFTPGP